MPMVAWILVLGLGLLAPGAGWPSTQKSAPSLLTGEVWSTQCRAAEPAEVQGPGHSICVKSPSSPPQTRERMLGRPHCHSSAQPQESTAEGDVGGTRQTWKAWSSALTSKDTTPSSLPWAVSGLCLEHLLLALTGSESRQTMGGLCAPSVPWCSRQVVLAE